MTANTNSIRKTVNGIFEALGQVTKVDVINRMIFVQVTGDWFDAIEVQQWAEKVIGWDVQLQN